MRGTNKPSPRLRLRLILSYHRSVPSAQVRPRYIATLLSGLHYNPIGGGYGTQVNALGAQPTIASAVGSKTGIMKLFPGRGALAG